MTTLQTSLEANCDRQTDRQDDKATYRGSRYRSAQKKDNLKNEDNLEKLDQHIKSWIKRLKFRLIDWWIKSYIKKW